MLLASGVPSVTELANFLSARGPQAVLFPHTPAGRVLGPGVAQLLDGSLCSYAADLALDPVDQRILATSRCYTITRAR